MRESVIRIPTGTIAITAVLLISNAARSEEPPAAPRREASLLGWSITPGIGARTLDLRVTRSADGATGTITSDGSFTGPLYASLGVESPTYLLNDVFGVTVRAHATSFSLDNQRVKPVNSQSNEDIVGLGSRVSGYYSYVTPTVFYRKPDGRGDVRWGLGYGWWNARFSGDIILAPDSAATANMPKTSISGSVSDRGGWLLFMQARWERGLFEVAFNTTRFSAPGYRYQMQEMNLMLGLHFEF